MSKETMMASDCACGQRIQFVEQHLPHCTATKGAKLTPGMQAIKDGMVNAAITLGHDPVLAARAADTVLTKGALAQVITQGQVADKKISRAKRASKSNTHAKKGKAERGQS